MNVENNSEEAPWVDSVRQQLPVVGACAYLNTGTAGPIPLSSHRAIDREADWELRHGRGNFALFGRFIELQARTRSLVARVLGAEYDEIALTHHTSEGVNIVLAGIDWRPGDSVVTTTLEHDAVAVPFAVLRDRLGVEPRFADIGHGERASEGLARAMTETTRLVVLSHIVWSTGALLPMEELIAQAHAAGVAVLVDGAQSCGALPVDVRQLDADYYTVSGQKWLCGPEGTGALFVRRDRIERLRPSFASYFSAASHDYRGRVTFHPSARRFETAMVYRPSLAGFEASLEWMLDEVGIERAWRRSLTLAGYCRDALARLEGVRILTPANQPSQLVSFDLPDFSPAQLHGLSDQLAERGVVVRSIDCPPYAVRASLGFFNTRADVDRLVTEVREALESGPDAIPLEGWAARLPRSR